MNENRDMMERDGTDDMTDYDADESELLKQAISRNSTYTKNQKVWIGFSVLASLSISLSLPSEQTNKALLLFVTPFLDFLGLHRKKKQKAF